MRRSMCRAALLVAMFALGTSACGSDDDNTDTQTPTTPTTPTTTETFEGELKINGASSYAFITATSGTVTTTLTALNPSGSPTVGLSLGTWNGSACQIIIANDAAAQGAVVTGNVSAATTLCTRIYDAGKLTDTVTYTLTVVHP
jgi:hypothetical protein